MMPNGHEPKFRFRIRRKGNGVEDVSFFYFTMNMILEGWLKPLEKYEEWEILSIDRFTGLTDMADEEIYENDITKPHDDNGLRFAHHIRFQHGCFGYEADSSGELIPLGKNHHYFDLPNGSHKTDKLIIIGNAHENPQLLQEIGKWMN